ncbi:MAG: hypothetical protein E7091_10285 [Bacteroidales bacterium]|nr:hypothetical protein [Bacteroidales bacterium]
MGCGEYPQGQHRGEGGVRVVDEPTADLTEVGLALSEREDIQSVIGCNVADNTQKLAFFALARKKENINRL